MSNHGENAVRDDLSAVIETIESELDEANSELNRAEQTIEQCQRKLTILRERDDMPGESR